MADTASNPGSEDLLPVRHVTRPQAIEELREKLKQLETPDNCVCAVVGQLGIFCKGFSRLDGKEVAQRFDWIARRNPTAPRESLEHLASLYHLGRQEATGAEICCDVETREHTGCDGWNGFDNAALERFVLALTGEPVRIQ